MLGLGLNLTSRSYAFTPLNVSDLNLWLQNGVGLVLDTSVGPNPVEQWNDSSGNNNHISQSSDERATVLDGGLNFEADNNNHYALTTGIDIGNNNAFTLFVVLTASLSCSILSLRSTKKLLIQFTTCELFLE